MPNWCEGYLRIRGSINHLEKFFKNAFDLPQGETRTIEELIETHFYKDRRYKEFFVEINGDVWFKDSQRGFVEAGSDNVTYSNKTGELHVIVLRFRQAWGCSPDYFVDISKKYNVDFRFFGGEQGMEFTQEFEIINGELTLDVTTNYDDWAWESPVPAWGG